MARKGRGSTETYQQLEYDLTRILDLCSDYSSLQKNASLCEMFFYAHVCDWMGRGANELTAGFIACLDSLQSGGHEQYRFRQTKHMGTRITASITNSSAMVRITRQILQLEAMNSGMREVDPVNQWRVGPCIICGEAIAQSESHPKSYCSGKCRVYSSRNELTPWLGKGSKKGQGVEGARILRGISKQLAAQCRHIALVCLRDTIEDLPFDPIEMELAEHPHDVGYLWLKSGLGENLRSWKQKVEAFRNFKDFHLAPVVSFGASKPTDDSDTHEIRQGPLADEFSNVYVDPALHMEPAAAKQLLVHALIDVLKVNPLAFAGALGDDLRAQLKAIDPKNSMILVKIDDPDTRPKQWGSELSESTLWFEADEDDEDRYVFKLKGKNGRLKTQIFGIDELADMEIS